VGPDRDARKKNGGAAPAGDSRFFSWRRARTSIEGRLHVKFTIKAGIIDPGRRRKRIEHGEKTRETGAGGRRSALDQDQHNGKNKATIPMPEYNDDEIPGDMGWGPIVVRRAVYDAAMALKTEGLPAFEHARLQAEKYRAAGDAGNAALFEDIFNFMLWRQSVRAGTQTIILEDGEEWDAAKGE